MSNSRYVNFRRDRNSVDRLQFFPPGLGVIGNPHSGDKISVGQLCRQGYHLIRLCLLPGDFLENILSGYGVGRGRGSYDS